MDLHSSSHSIKVATLLLAAGSGTRMGEAAGGRNKTLLKIGGIPILAYSLRKLARHPRIRRLLLVHRPSDCSAVEGLVKSEGLVDRVDFVDGGAERFESVYNGLLRLSENPPDIVLIHDSARPFLTDRMIDESIEKAREVGAATVAVPLSDTLKRKEGDALVETLPRTNLYRIQTPQAFRFDLIWDAHQKLKKNPDPMVTDDCMLLEREGHGIGLVLGDETNIKVTAPFDLQLAEWLISRGMKKTTDISE